jgi:glycosyltransferase involved in cell wall biosynthesis
MRVKCVNVLFVLPMAVPQGAGTHVSFRTPATLAESPPPAGGIQAGGEFQTGFRHMEVHVLPAVLQAYAGPQSYAQAMETLRQLRLSAQGAPAGLPSGLVATSALGGGYHGDLMAQVQRYANLAVELAGREDFDVVHAHDWMTYPAGLAVAAYTGKPLVVHLHSTEFDRSGENINQQVYEIERAGLHGADTVVCVSYLTRSIALARYGLPPEKVEVVYNAVESPQAQSLDTTPIARDEKIVLFLGRVTMQKGPEYLLQAAKKVLKKHKKVRFVIAGSGDLIGKAVELAADLRIGRHVTFTGFLRGDDVARVFRMADLYVMPSVSEPFGIAPLEALSHNVPVIISKQSGVSEVLTHVLKVDFWDTDEMANKILAVLRHPPLQRVLRQQGQIELRKLSWRDSAVKCKEIYERITRAASAA